MKQTKPIIVTCPYLRAAFKELHPDKQLTVELRKAHKTAVDGGLCRLRSLYKSPKDLTKSFIWKYSPQEKGAGRYYWLDIYNLAENYAVRGC